MRRPLAITLLALAVNLVTVLPLTAAGAAATETVTFAWPASTSVPAGTPATLVITDTGLTGPRRVTAADGQGVVLYTGYLTVASPSVTIPLPTARIGQFATDVGVFDDATGTEVGHDRWAYTVVGLPSTITVRFPAPRSVLSGVKVAPVRGTVAGPAGRGVEVQAKAATGWVTLGRARTTSAGGFTITTPTWWVHQQTLRVYAPATGVYLAATSDHTGSVTVKRRYTPRAGRAFSYAGGGSRARWNPCRVHTYRVNPQLLPAHGLADVKEGFRRLSEATGFRFAYVGTTTKVPGLRGNWGSETVAPDADFVIAWATPRQVPALRGSVIGLGGAWSGISAGWTEMSHGFVVFDATYRLAAGYSGARYVRGAVILHELGHAVGLGHVLDKRQVMYPALRPDAGSYAAGDLRGLASVGAARGCIGQSATAGREHVPGLVTRPRVPVVSATYR